MSKQKRRLDWTPIDEEDARELILATGGPGAVFQLPVSNLPKKLRGIRGVKSYFVSGYRDPQDVPPNPHLLGEMAVGRIDGDMSKHYVYVYAISNDGTLKYAGPFKRFPLHHVASASQFPVEELFGHHRLATRNKAD